MRNHWLFMLMPRLTLAAMAFFVGIALIGCSGSESVEKKSPTPIVKDEPQTEATFQGKTISQWIKTLESSEEPSEYVAASKALGEIGPAAKEAVPALFEAMKNNANEVEIIVALTGALREISPDGQDLVPVYIDLLKDKDPTRRFGLLLPWGKSGPRPRKPCLP
ncbi:MAG: hypothetical protein COA78_18170 [Blastopirellula sp.]|nr:MAG: hypothetical protein COA78_18170 [Blastopirellula sp.]